MAVIPPPSAIPAGLIPAITGAGHSVTIAPEGWLVDDEAAVQAIIAGYTGSAAELSFNQAQQQAALAAKYGSLVAAGRSYNGKTWQIDASSQGLIASASIWATVAASANVPWSITWVAADNSTVTMDRLTFLAFAQNIAAYVEALFANNYALKTAIAGATTMTALNAIDVTQDWPSNP